MAFSLQHLVREPKIKSEKSPLLLLLHGYGSNEQDLFSFADELPNDSYVVSVRAPFNLQFGSYAWYSINFDADENKFSDIEEAKQSSQLIIKYIDELVAFYPIDAQKITLIGFSQGAILSYGIGLSYPQKINKIVAMSGYFNDKIPNHDFENNDLRNLKIFASHGSVDQVVPVDWARKAAPALSKLGVKIEYREYPMGHTISQNNFYDMKNWLENN